MQCFCARVRVKSMARQRQRQQQFNAGDAGFGFGKRQLLGVFIDRRVIRTDRIDNAVSHTLPQRVAIAQRSQGWGEIAMRIEITQVHFG